MRFVIATILLIIIQSNSCEANRGIIKTYLRNINKDVWNTNYNEIYDEANYNNTTYKQTFVPIKNDNINVLFDNKRLNEFIINKLIFKYLIIVGIHLFLE
jgi:hypothetical protein